MEQETLFTSSKWDILQTLGKGPKSPLELAKETNTSIANISQQLRLLELGGLVSKQRVSNRDKDQPRLAYSLGGHRSFIINLSEGFVKKELIDVSDEEQITLRTLFLNDKTRQYFVQKYFWTQVESELDKIEAIAVRNEYTTLRFFIITDKSIKLKEQTLEKDGMKMKIVPEIIQKDKLGKIDSQEIHVLHDPDNIFYNKVGGISGD